MQALAERLDAVIGGQPFAGFDALSFSSLKTVVPPPDAFVGHEVDRVTRRGKYLVFEAGDAGAFSYLAMVVDGPSYGAKTEAILENAEESVSFFNFDKERYKQSVFYDLCGALPVVELDDAVALTVAERASDQLIGRIVSRRRQ